MAICGHDQRQLEFVTWTISQMHTGNCWIASKHFSTQFYDWSGSEFNSMTDLAYPP